LRVEIAKREYMFILINNVCGNFARSDFAEDAVGHFMSCRNVFEFKVGWYAS